MPIRSRFDDVPRLIDAIAQCFEGTKAYKDKEGRVRMFRPMDNVNRLSISSTRLALPSFDKTELLECVKELVRVDSDYIPTGKGYSLYLRPTFIGTTVGHIHRYTPYPRPSLAPH